MLKRFLGLGKVRIGLAIIGVFVLAAIFGPALSQNVLGYTPADIDYYALGTPPSSAHLLGTTSSGQDVMAWMLYGARSAILVGFASAVIGTALTVIIGMCAGFFGGFVDRLLNAVILVFQNMPSFALLFIVAAAVGSTNWLLVSVIIGGLEWTGGARQIRAQAMSLRGRDFTTALRTVGESPVRIVLVELLPHLYGVISPMFLRLIAAGVGMQAALAFLGIGSAAEPSWGLMINYAMMQNALFRGMWWWFAPPGLCLALIGFATTMINFGLDEITNPSLSSRRMRLMRIFARKKKQEQLRAQEVAAA